MKHIYYYIPPCPRCKSRKTGHYLKTPFSGAGYTREQSLKMGELVRFLPKEPYKNAFCMNCGYEWPTRVETKFWPSERIQEEREARGTEEMYLRLLQEKEDQDEEKGLLGMFFGRKKSAATRYEKQDMEERSEILRNSDDDAEIIDRRPRDVIEILYADEELIQKIRGSRR